MILISIIITIILITGFCTKLSIPQNFKNDARGWLEMCCGMFAFCFSNFIKNKDFKNYVSSILRIIELVCYNVPVILGFAPINKKYMQYIMGVTVLCTFFALSITFSNKGIEIKNEKINKFFGYLGNISLPIYMFQSIVIGITFLFGEIDAWKSYLIVIFGVILISVFYKLLYDLINKCIEKIKNREHETLLYTNIE